MFEYLKTIEKKKKLLDPEVKLNINTNIRINEDMIKALNVDEYTDDELNKLCLESYDRILKHTLSDSAAIERLLLNERFIIAFTNAMYNVTLSEQQKIQVCNIIYALRMQYREDEYHFNALLLNLGSVIHRDKIPSIMGIGFNKDLAGELVIAQYSSIKSLKQVKRINRVLLTIKEDLPIDIIVRLYEALGFFSHFSDLFEGIMYDKIYDKLTDHQQEIYASINIALLDIMEEMPNQLCYTLLLNFADMSFMRSDMKIRFNLHSCSVTDYPRINMAINQVEQGGYIIPY